MTIRRAQAADLPLLSEYWYDRVALLQQMGAPLRLLPEARSRWEAAAEGWLSDETIIFLTYVINKSAGGAIIGTIKQNQPGLAPERYGHLMQLIIDLHTPHQQQGMGGALLNAFRNKLQQQGIQRLAADVSTTLAVEAAFWRGVGAQRTHTVFWMDV